MTEPTTLAEIAAALATKKLPPVETWHPTHCGHSGMRIAADGTWFHEGRAIGRPSMVALFATILRREADGTYVLVTPGEKLDIDVDDAPFVAVEATIEGAAEGRRIGFRLNTDDHIIAGADHALRFETSPDGTPRPYVHVRGRLDALINRAVFYELVDLALDEGATPPGLWSDGVFFSFAPS